MSRSTSRDSSEVTSSMMAEKGSEQGAEKAFAAELCVVMFDDGLDWSHRQQEVLAVAQDVAAQGFDMCIFCPAGSVLMQKAQELQLATQFLGSAFITRCKILWKYKRKKPLLLHSFSAATASLAQACSRWRLEGASLCIHSLYEEPHGEASAQESAQLANQISLYKKVQFCIFSSVFMKKQWEKQGFTPVVSSCIFTALPVEPWKAMVRHQNNYALKDGRCLFLVTAKLCAGSGLSTVFKAMKLLLEHEETHAQSNSFEVRVLGSGAEFESILTEARGLGVEGRLALLGEQDLAEVLPWVHGLILPQEEAMQCSAMYPALLGAWNLGLPVVCSDLPPYTEMSHAKMLLFSPKDAEGLAARMRALLQREPLRQEQGAYSIAQKDFSLMPRLQQEYKQAYANALEQNGWGFMCKQ